MCVHEQWCMILRQVPKEQQLMGDSSPRLREVGDSHLYCQAQNSQQWLWLLQRRV